MAEEVEEEPKKSNLLKIIIFVVGGFLLIAVGLGIGYFIFGGEPEPEAEKVLERRVQLKRAVRRVAMQVHCDADDGNVRQDKRDCNQLPHRQIK